MNWTEIEKLDSWAAVDPYDVPLDKIDMSRPELYEADVQERWFARLREEDPVHYSATGPSGPFWSITKFNDIMAVDTNPKVFSSDRNIVIGDQPPELPFTQFIAMDDPKHAVQRLAVTPTVSPKNLIELESVIREKVCLVLDGLPLGEEFNWVDRVSIEITTYMLAILFNFPMEDRKKLTYWSDMATASELLGDTSVDPQIRHEALMECLQYFTALWREREGNKPSYDFISMLANNPDTKDMVDDPMEFLGNLILLIVGGNDTTRNSMTSGVLQLNRNPEEYDKLRNNLDLIPSLVSETIRWQTPLGHMRRTALEDVELGGKLIKKGDRVVMWYTSGNRDDSVIDRPNEYIIDRPKVRHHISFGFGVHRCMGNRVAETQLRILWEEIMNRFSFVEVVGKPVRLANNFVLGFTDLPVVLHAK